MNEKLIDYFAECLKGFTILLSVWIVLNLFPAVVGILDSLVSPERCYKNNPQRRIEYVLPGHNFGCWIMKPVHRKSENDK